MVKASTPSVTVVKMPGLIWELKASSKWGYLGLWWADGQGILPIKAVHSGSSKQSNLGSLTPWLLGLKTPKAQGSSAFCCSPDNIKAL